MLFAQHEIDDRNTPRARDLLEDCDLRWIIREFVQAVRESTTVLVSFLSMCLHVTEHMEHTLRVHWKVWKTRNRRKKTYVPLLSLSARW